MPYFISQMAYQMAKMSQKSSFYQNIVCVKVFCFCYNHPDLFNEFYVTESLNYINLYICKGTV